MTTERKRVPAEPVTDRTGLCRATAKGGEPCRKKAVRDGLCLVHRGEQDMRPMGRLGGRVVSKAKREAADGERQPLRDYLREQADPADVWKAIQSGLASTNERDKLAAAKLLLGELYEPADERQREEAASVAAARARLAVRVDEMSARRIVATLVERGIVRPGGGRPVCGAS